MNQISFGYSNPLIERFGDEFFKKLPVEAGVYFFLGSDRRPLYIGKADCLKKRLASYKSAKPGQVAEHILEMIEHATEIIWETHPDGVKALKREIELIRSLKPPFNILGTDTIPFLSVGIQPGREARPGVHHIEFRLSHNSMPTGFETFGCFMHRGKTKLGYSALLRLLFVATCERDRFQLPAKLCRTSPAYIHRGLIPRDWMKLLVQFMRGESPRILKEITTRLLEKDNVPPYLYAPLQRDLMMAQEFYRVGPLSTRKLIRAAGEKKSFLSQRQLEKIETQLSLAHVASVANQHRSEERT